MAEEDLIFGKNRHFFGGIEPSNMKEFRAVSCYDVDSAAARIKLIVSLPSDTVIESQTLCTVAGAVIRKSTTGFPESEFDGELFKDISEDGEILDTDVELGTTYYYSAFPYTTQGVFNRNSANRSSATAKTYTYLFGYDLDTTNDTPADRVTYPEDVDNADYNAAGMNFTDGVFDYGDWPSECGEKFMPRPCMLTYDGVVSAYLDPSDYTLNEDGTASRVADLTFHGNAMIEWPKIYAHREESDGIYKFRCSDVPLGDDWDCWSNYDANNKEIEHFYTPIYSGSNASGTLRSISGASNLTKVNVSTGVQYAEANGEGWYIEVIADRLLIQDLLIMMGKSTDTQLVYGYGRTASGNTSALAPGTMDSSGFFWGTSANRTKGVKVFGMENFYGNLWRRTAGWINDKGTQKIKITRGMHDGSTTDDYNATGEGYIELADATPAGTNGGYISAMKTTAFGHIPVTAKGSSTTYECDGLNYSNTQVDYAMVGGCYNSNLLAGVYQVHLATLATATGASTGVALSYKPAA
ncbi:MAG: hypothetical protein LUE92_12145 [Clostridiales bacterium]|nr:hypothetical protein [Clostridiales bacterium]